MRFALIALALSAMSAAVPVQQQEGSVIVARDTESLPARDSVDLLRRACKEKRDRKIIAAGESVLDTEACTPYKQKRDTEAADLLRRACKEKRDRKIIAAGESVLDTEACTPYKEKRDRKIIGAGESVVDAESTVPYKEKRDRKIIGAGESVVDAESTVPYKEKRTGVYSKYEGHTDDE